MRENASRARRILHAEFGGEPNFMTPSVVGTGLLSDNIAWEISSGSGVFGKTIYGVTVVTEGGRTSRDFKMSDCFDSHKAASQYIKGLREEVKYD